MKYEKPQKGNPHNLTIQQHTFPAASITRFVNDAGVVTVCHIPSGKILNLPPDNQLFCAKRNWDQRAEAGYMKEIEDSFQSLAEDLISESVSVIGAEEKRIIANFFALLVFRTESKANPLPDQSVPGIVELEHAPTKDEQELLEKNGIGFIRPDFTIPGRQLMGINIQKNIIRTPKELADTRWGILKTQSGEFIVPDRFAGLNVVPLTPTCCLLSPSQNREISSHELVRINRKAVSVCREYYFGRDLSRSPR
jgi:hypothetical protein